jgi:hypothetical protein
MSRGENPDPVKVERVVAKARRPWKSWAEDFAHFRRISLSQLIGDSVERAAKQDGFRPEPPRRI